MQRIMSIITSALGVAKGMPGRTQAIPNACCSPPPNLQKDRDTLVEQSNILLKQSVTM